MRSSKEMWWEGLGLDRKESAGKKFGGEVRECKSSHAWELEGAGVGDGDDVVALND
jgi:hypothetical protein